MKSFNKKYKAKLLKCNKNNVLSANSLLVANVNPCTPEAIKKQTFRTRNNLCSYHKFDNENACNCSYKSSPMSHLVAAMIERWSYFNNPKKDKQQKQN